MRQKNILLFIPTYNCERQIPRVLDKVRQISSEFSCKVLVVDNGSSDDTLNQVCNFSANHPSLDISIFKNNLNYGLGGSHKVAFSYCHSQNIDYCLVLHGDDQADINDFRQILGTKEYQQYDHTFGSRFHRGSKLSGYSFIRTQGNYFFNQLASLITGKQISDFGGSGINIFSIKALNGNDGLPFLGYSNDLTFHPHLLLDAIRNGHKMVFKPITWREEDQISNVKIISQTKKLFSILWSYTKKSCAPTSEQLSSLDYSYQIVHAHSPT